MSETEALAEPETWRIRFENARFSTWFAPAPETGDEVPLDRRIRDFDTAAAGEKCHDDTKRQRAEHMLDSYSRLADNNVRDLKRETERAEKLSSSTASA